MSFAQSQGTPDMMSLLGIKGREPMLTNLCPCALYACKSVMDDIQFALDAKDMVFTAAGPDPQDTVPPA